MAERGEVTKRYLTISNQAFLELASQLQPAERRNEDERGMNLIVYVQRDGEGSLTQLVLVPTNYEALIEAIRQI